MAKDNRISMPQSIGGLVRYFDDYKSKIEFSPTAVIIISVVIIILTLFLQTILVQ